MPCCEVGTGLLLWWGQGLVWERRPGGRVGVQTPSPNHLGIPITAKTRFPWERPLQPSPGVGGVCLCPPFH